jgi:hypothetical protein
MTFAFSPADLNLRALAGMLALGAAALVVTGCAPAAQSTAELSVTSADDGGQTTQKISLTDLTCSTSSSARTISSASVNSAGKEVFTAMAPTDGRKTYPVSLWFDGHWFVSSTPFDASGSTITFDALQGSVSESPDGEYPTSAGAEATLDGTITCSS